MTRTTRRTRRILIALDPAAPRSDTFAPVAALSRRGRAELQGLFVEDVNLLRLSTLPFAQEIRPGPRPHTDASRSIDRERIEAQLRARAQEVRHTFEQGAAKLHMRYRFSVRRGEVLDELAAAAREAEMLVIGRSVRSAGPRTWLGVRFDRLAEAAQSAGVSLVFVREPWESGSQVLVIWDGTESAARALDTASSFAETEGLALAVAVVGDDAEHRQRAVQALERTLDDAGLEADLRDAGALDASVLRRLCIDADARVLVLPGDCARQRALALGGLLATLPTSLVLQH